MSKHTPGPWKRQVNGVHAERIECQGDFYVECEGPDYETINANAKLIAAAPELLEACKNLIHEITYGDVQVFEEPNIHCMSAIEDAIAKAEGTAQDSQVPNQ